MKITTALLVTSLLLLFSSANAQIRFEKTYGGADSDFAYSVKQTSDDGYIILGSTESFGVEVRDLYLLKTDRYGEIQWTKTYGGMGFDAGTDLDQTHDDGFILCGSKNLQAFLVKTTSDGDTIWTNTFEGMAYSVQQTVDGGYIVGGTIFMGPANYDMLLMKTNADGELLWTKNYELMGLDECREVVQTNDGGFILVGHGNGGINLVKTDSKGMISWTKPYGGRAGYSVKQTQDDGYILLGELSLFGDNHYYMIKTDGSGETLWTKTFYKGDVNDDQCEILQTTDQGYVFTGEINTLQVPNRKVYMVRTDEMGEPLWTRTYRSGYGNAMDITSDGGYVVIGFTYEFGAGLHDIYLIKTDSNGHSSYVPYDVPSAELNKTLDITAFPNPFYDFTTINVAHSNANNPELTLFNVQGQVMRKIMNATNDRFVIEKQDLQSGLYFFQLSAEGKVIGKGKLMVE